MNTIERKNIEKENRRQDILDAAVTVMKSHGLHGLSIDLIAHETNLAKGTIYLYFKNKEEILSILTIRARTLLIKDFQKIEKNKESNIEQLKSILKSNYLFYKKNSLYYDLVSLYEVNNRMTETEEMQQSGEKIMKIVVGIAGRAREEGTLNPKISPVILAMSLWGMAVGMLQLIKVRGAIMKEKLNISEKDLLNSFIQLLENGVKK
ncbi:TetR/AcrR family transcriptional regulator [Ferruginibacter sp.]|uniref:TetR/AcrR family transcriptional regulator n=1 Tax=Ferruginibacter sp. TaxID=1940288 RepID=UPI0019A4AE96|nr:TetR/AcrR family transcriptional regulator [Ferruginibacter sp.]MBC7628995.1 TetR/AcrR family transcriptional regulator [Ferruginibacter sp.]